MAANTILQIPPRNVLPIDKNGQMNEQWWRFLLSLSTALQNGVTVTAMPVVTLTTVNGVVTEVT